MSIPVERLGVLAVKAAQKKQAGKFDRHVNALVRIGSHEAFTTLRKVVEEYQVRARFRINGLRAMARFPRGEPFRYLINAAKHGVAMRFIPLKEAEKILEKSDNPAMIEEYVRNFSQHNYSYSEAMTAARILENIHQAGKRSLKARRHPLFKAISAIHPHLLPREKNDVLFILPATSIALRNPKSVAKPEAARLFVKQLRAMHGRVK